MNHLTMLEQTVELEVPCRKRLGLPQGEAGVFVGKCYCKTVGTRWRQFGVL